MSDYEVLEDRGCVFFLNFYWSIVALQYCVSFAIQQSESVIHISPRKINFKHKLIGPTLNLAKDIWPDGFDFGMLKAI